MSSGIYNHRNMQLQQQQQQQPQGGQGPSTSSPPTAGPGQHHHHHHHHQNHVSGHHHQHGHSVALGPGQHPAVHHHHHHQQQQQQPHGHHAHPSAGGPPQHHGPTGPGVPPSTNGRREGHGRTHSVGGQMNGFVDRESRGERERGEMMHQQPRGGRERERERERERDRDGERDRDRDRERRERGRDRGMSTHSVGGPPLPPPPPPPTAGPGVVGPEDRDHMHRMQQLQQHQQQQQRFQQRQQQRELGIQQPQNNLAAVAAAADAMSASVGAASAPVPPASAPPPSSSGPAASGRGPGTVLGAAAVRLSDSMDIIKGEYEGLAGELSMARVQRDDLDAKILLQVSELTAIRQSFYELETQHVRVREQFEQELARLRADLRVAKQQQAQQQQGPPGQGSSQPQGPPGGPTRASGSGSVHGTPLVHHEYVGPNAAGMRSGRSSPEPMGHHSHQSVFYKPGRREREGERMPDLRDAKRMRVDLEGGGGGSGSGSGVGGGGGPGSPPPSLPLPPVSLGPNDGTIPSSSKLPVLGSGSRAAMKEREREAREKELLLMKEGGAGGGLAAAPGAAASKIEFYHGPPHANPTQQPPSSSSYNRHPNQQSHQQQQLPHHQQQQQPHTSTLGSTPRFPPVPGTVNTGGSGGYYHGPPPQPPSAPPLSTSSQQQQQQQQQNSNAGSLGREGASDDAAGGDAIPPAAAAAVDGNGGGTTEAAVLPFPGTLDVFNAPPEWKKEGSDWSALFNPDMGVGTGKGGREKGRGLDVSLVHSIQHDSVVCCVKFSADGKYLATGCNKSAQIFNTQSGLQTCSLVDEAGPAGKQADLYIRSVCFSPCGRWLATGAEDKIIRVWDIAFERIRCVFDGHQQEIYALEFSLDGRLLVSGSGDKTVRVWDVAAALFPPTRSGNNNGASSGGDAAEGTSDDPPQPIVLTIEDSASDKMPGVDVDGDAEDDDDDDDDDDELEGRRSGRTRSSNRNRNKLQKQRRAEGGGDGRGDRMEAVDDRMQVDDREEDDEEADGNSDSGITSIAVSPDGRYVAAGSLDNIIRLWDLQQPSSALVVGSGSGSGDRPPVLIERLRGHKDSVYSVSFTRDGRFLVSASLDKGVRVWDVSHLGIAPAPGSTGTSDDANDISSRPGGSGRGKRRGRSVEARRPITRRMKQQQQKSVCVTQFVGHRDYVLSVAVSFDGRWVVSGSKDRAVMWWELGSPSSDDSSGKEKEMGAREKRVGTKKDKEAVCVLQGHKNSVISIDLSPVGSMLATGSGDWVARIWSYKTAL